MKIIESIKTDILVVGGGPAGIMAAKAAAVEGENVMLIERYGYLGGSATMSLVVPLMTFHAGEKQIVKGYAQDLLDEMKKYGGFEEHFIDPLGFGSSVTPVDTEVYKYVAQEFLLEEGVDIRFHTELVSVNSSGNEIESVIVKTRSGFYEIIAKRFIDASGDGDLAYMADNPMKIGRDKDGKVQPMTMMFKIGNVDIEALIDYADAHPDQFVIDEDYNSLSEFKRIGISGFFEMVKEAKVDGALTFDRDRVLFFELLERGEIAVNMSRIINKLSVHDFDLSNASIEGRRQIFEILQFFKKYLPGFENARIIESAHQVGVRESRRIDGQYVLNEHDVVLGRAFEDGIACASWPIDIHDPEGKELIVTHMEKGTYYEIPYRSLLPKKSKNLIVAGRNISATHEALASARVSPTCMAMGQAAGIAASMSLSEQIPFDQVDTKKLRARLYETGQVLKIR
ncbi:MAG TPA: FAD-dependent oxidoreductase [Erysipelothrix sp.]